MLFLRWLILHSSLIAIVFCTLAKQEKLTLEIDEEEGSKSTITFEPAVVNALKQPHSLDDLLQREEWRDELESLDIITSNFKDKSDQFATDLERINAEELVKKSDPLCASLPPLLDDDPNLSIYPSTHCSSLAECRAPCPEDLTNEIEGMYEGESENDDAQEPFCDELIGSEDSDDEIVQAISSNGGQKFINVTGMSHCSASGRALTQALRNKYRLVDSLHYTAFYWLKHNEPGYAIYCLRNLARLATEQEDEYRLKDTQFLVAQLYFHAKRYKTSIHILTLLLEAPPPSAILLRSLASRLLHADNCTTALKYFKMASDLDSSLVTDKEFQVEWNFCQCRSKVIGLLGKEQKKLQRMERELQLHSLISSRTISKQRYSDSWLAFSHVKFGPLPGLQCKDTVNARKHWRLQCRITNLIDYFGTTVKKLDDYRSGLEDLNDHEEHLLNYDAQRYEQELKLGSEMDQFLEKLRPNVGLQIEVESKRQAKSSQSSLFFGYDLSNRHQISQKLCELRLEKQPLDSDHNDLIYISLESRGYPVRELLNERLNLLPTDIHPLPWDLPYCQQMDKHSWNQTLLRELADKWSLTGVNANTINRLLDEPSLYKAESELLPHLADLMGLGSSANLLLGDFGQRVRTLMQFRIGPDWLHRELASLLFRALGLFREAFDCLLLNLNNHLLKDGNEKRVDMTLIQLFGMLYRANTDGENSNEELAFLKTIYAFNMETDFKEASIPHQIAKRMNSGDAVAYLWQAFQIDNTHQPTLHALKDYYCNRRVKLGFPIQQKYEPICCWQTEHDVYCFRRLGLEGACFKIKTELENDRVEHEFNSFRCSGKYVARSFAPPPIARFIVGFIKPASEFRDQLVREKIDEFLQAERKHKNKEAKMNAKKVLPLDYGGYSKRRISQFITRSDDSVYPLETKFYVDSDYQSTNNVVKDGKLRPGIESFEDMYDPDEVDKMELEKMELKLQEILRKDDESNFYQMWNGDLIKLYNNYPEDYDQKSREEIDFTNWSEIIRIDMPRPKSIPHPDTQLVHQGEQVFELPTKTEMSKFCSQRELKHFLEPVSTYLSISVKGVNIDSLIDRDAKLVAQNLEEPFCLPKTADFDRLFHGLPGTQFSDRIKLYKPEKALRDALLSMGNSKDTVSMVGARLAAAIKRLGDVENKKKGDGSYWALATAAALYWRVKGNPHAAITCLIQSLDYAPRHMEDVAAVSLANIYHQTGFLHSALVAGHYGLQASGGSIVGVHFTLANIYASMGEHKLAEQFYFSTLALQSNFQAAKDRILALQCLNK